jgi:hypothetical protein
MKGQEFPNRPLATLPCLKQTDFKAWQKGSLKHPTTSLRAKCGWQNAWYDLLCVVGLMFCIPRIGSTNWAMERDSYTTVH